MRTITLAVLIWSKKSESNHILALTVLNKRYWVSLWDQCDAKNQNRNKETKLWENNLIHGFGWSEKYYRVESYIIAHIIPLQNNNNTNNTLDSKFLDLCDWGRY